MARVASGISAVAAELRQLPADAWNARGVHPTLGVMPLERIVVRFIIGHLEEHADQLEQLTRQ